MNAADQPSPGTGSPGASPPPAGLVATYAGDTADGAPPVDGELIVRDGELCFDGSVLRGARMEPVRVRLAVDDITEVSLQPLRSGLGTLPRAAVGFARVPCQATFAALRWLQTHRIAASSVPGILPVCRGHCVLALLGFRNHDISNVA